jgi:2-desacetyl-2-hydroxyethyl bacteriochlorophyllide A dehydrogenase
MKAARIPHPDQIEIVEIPPQEPAGSEVLIRVMASGICGTDIHIYRGEYLGGYPVIPGHEFSGLVEAVGPQVTRYQAGDRVAVEPNIACDNCFHCLNNRQNFCLNWQAVGVTRPGGMAQWVTAPEKAVFKIGDLPFEAGAFMEPLSCVLHGLERLNPGIASRVALLGAGPIGLLLLQGLRLRGAAQVAVVEKNPARLELARSLGADQCLASLDDLEQDGYDSVVDATGSLPVMSRAVEFARPGGKVLLFGVPPSGKSMPIEPFRIFRKGLTILASFTSVRNSLQALDLLQTGRIVVEPLVSHRLPLEQLERGIHTLEQGQERVKKILILPNPS